MSVPAPDREVTLAERLSPELLREGAVASRERRLAISPSGRIVRANYHLGPFSHQ